MEDLLKFITDLLAKWNLDPAFTAFVVAVIGFLFRDKVEAFVVKLPFGQKILDFFKNLAKPKSESPNVADMEALERLQARSKRRGCPKLEAEVEAVAHSFFNGSESGPPATTPVASLSY